jgi:peptidoglycan/LPS O-acetylase OafA/YrhL
MPASHHAVILFFVISGFSVAFSADKIDRNPSEFLAARLSRIFSVAVPAILITLLIDFASKAVHPQASDLWQLNRWFSYLVFALSFSGELWFTSIHPFSNIPFWSLNYELYYYLFFAALLINSQVLRILCSSIVLLVIGPKIALLLPCWLCGVGLYEWSKRSPKNTTPTNRHPLFIFLVWAFFVLSYLAITQSDVATWTLSFAQNYQSKLRYSKDFVFDTALAVAFSFCLFLHSRANLTFEEQPRTFISKLAPLTFALYALHYPMLKFASEMPERSTGFAVNLLKVALVFMLCLFIGAMLEPTRKYWRKYILLVLKKSRGQST